MVINDVGLLVRLSSYSSREGPDAKEDFFTEALAHLLRKEPIVLKTFLRRLGWIGSLSNVNSLRTRTQVSFPNGSRADIVITDSITGAECIIESKICSPFDLEQIKAYLTLITDSTNSIVVSITKNAPESEIPSLAHFKHCYWSEIYHELKKLAQDCMSSDTRYILREIMQFMEVKSMAEFEGFDEYEIGVWSAFESFRGKVDSYIEHLEVLLHNKFSLVPKRKGKGGKHYLGLPFDEMNTIPLKRPLWVGFYNVDFGGGRRTYCCVLISKDKEFSLKKMQARLPEIRVPEGEYPDSTPGLFRPLASVTGSRERKEDQEKALDQFFVDTIERLKNKGLLAKKS